MHELLSSTLAYHLPPLPQTSVQQGEQGFPTTHRTRMEHPNMLQQHSCSFCFTSALYDAKGLYSGAQSEGIAQQVCTNSSCRQCPGRLHLPEKLC